MKTHHCQDQLKVKSRSVQNFCKITITVHCKLTFVFMKEHVSVMHSVHANNHCMLVLLLKVTYYRAYCVARLFTTTLSNVD